MFTTFVINLDKDTERMQFMHEHLSLLSIAYERIPAVYGRNYNYSSAEYDLQLINSKGLHPLLLGELGCALSHKKAYEMVCMRGIDYALILEDDVQLPENFKEILETSIRNHGHKRWEYLLFDYPAVGIPYIKKWYLSILKNYEARRSGSFSSKLKFVSYSIIKGCYLIPLSLGESVRNSWRKKHPAPVHFWRPVYFAGAYLLTNSGAVKMLSLCHPIQYTADQLPNQARIKRGLKFMCYAPLVVSQQKSVFGSSILDLSGDKI